MAASKSIKKKNSNSVRIINDETPEIYIKDKKQEIRSILDEDIRITAKNESQTDLIKNILSKEITICSGRAGTGKTIIALALALGLLRSENNKFVKIYLIKSVTPLKGEEIGYLKGDLNEKIEPFIWSFLLNIEKLLPSKNIKNIISSDIIKPFPIAFARGTSIDNSIIICDETQNITIDNMHTLMTRIGENSKMIILGDTKQIDLKQKKDSSLSKLIEMFTDVDEIGVVKMDDNDINVRNPLIDIIESKFDKYNGNH